MNSTRRFVLRSTVLRPSVILPILAGIAAGLAAWTSGGSTWLTGLSIIGIAGGVAWLWISTMLNVERVTEQALSIERQAELDSREARLDALGRQLLTDRDHRTQDCLRMLRNLHEDFMRLARQPGVERRSARFAEQVQQVFQVAVEQLRESLRLMEQAEGQVGQQREQIMAEREIIVNRVLTTQDRLKSVIQQFRELIEDDPERDLSALQHELELSLEVARRTEERMREIENPSANYESFVKE
ncbi:MAG: hypothetical protein KF752_15585 [Pirellulaceae bacterium]|nr:hypothetical protein [Pirellulaceae bacterium]